MSRRARRRRSGSPSTWRLIGFLAIVVPAVAVCLGGAWAVGVYDSAPALDELRPLGQDAVSSVYAADGSRLGFIHSDMVREPVFAGGSDP